VGIVGQGRSNEGECSSKPVRHTGRLLDIAVFNAYEVALRVGSLRERLGNRDRTMLPPGAPNADVEIRLSLGLIPGKEKGEEVCVPFNELLGLGVSEDVVPHSGIPTVLLPKLLNKVGIPQKSYVHHEIAIEGNAMFKAEGEEVYPHARPADGPKGIEKLSQLPSKGVDVEGGGVYEEIGRFLNRLKTRPLSRDCVSKGGVLGGVKTGVWASRFAVAPNDRLIVRVEKDNLKVLWTISLTLNNREELYATLA